MKKFFTVLIICCALFPVHSVLAASADTSSLPVLSRGHIQDLGDYPADGSWVESPNRIGTVGQSKRIEGFELKPDSSLPADIELRYNVHVQNIGWLYDENDPATWAKNGDYAGTRGDSLRIEAIKIILLDASGNKAAGYHVRYQGHVQDVGDLPADSQKWIVDGEQLGTVGSSLRLEALKLEIVKDAATGTDLSAYTTLIKQIDDLNESDYTKTSWTNLQTILKNHVVNGKNTAEQVAGAVNAIEAAIQQLENLSTTTAYEKPGNYGPSSGTETINQDVIITSTGVTLQNLTIDGNLIIDEAVGDGDVTLNNVTVSGELRVRGGGKNSIHINGGDYQNILVEKTPTGVVRIVVTGLDGTPFVLSEVAAGQEVILEGNFDSVTVNAPDAVIKTDKQTSIKQLNIAPEAKNSTVNLGSQTTVTDLSVQAPAKVTGSGTVSKAEIAADNVSFEKAPGNYTVDPEVVIPPVIPTPIPQPGGGSGGYTPPSKISLSVTTAPTVTPSKTYDGTTATDVTNQVLDTAVITGIVSGDTVTVSATATYDNKKARTAKTITINYTLSGDDAAKYSAPANVTVNDGEISKADLTLPAPTTTKTYDKTTTAKQTITPTAGKINGDVLTVTEAATFNDASVGKSKSGTIRYALTGTDADNYNALADQNFVGGEIIAKPIKITGTSVETSKTYNRNDVAAVKTIGTSTDIISGDAVIIGATAYYADKNAGTNKPIYVTYSLTGGAAANYQVAYTDPQTLTEHSGISFIKLIDTGVINKVQLTADNTATVADKTYDGTTAASVTHPPKISGFLNGDTFNLSFSGNFADANAGENKPVTINYQVTSGSGTENYLLPTNVTATATISPLEFETTKNFESCSKEYDGTSKATVKIDVLTQNQLVTNALKNKNITFEIVADYTDGSGNKKSAVGSNYTIAYSFKLIGEDAKNFKLTSSVANNVITGSETGGSITQKTLTITPPDIKTTRPYDGTSKVYDVNGAEISASYFVAASQITGLVTGESVAVTANLSSTDKDAGEQTVTISYSVGSDGNSGDYKILDQTIKVTITPLQLTIDGTTLPAIAATRKYDATKDVYLANNTTKLSDYPVSADAVSGLINNDAVTVKATASYDNKNIGENKSITTAYSLDGNATKNYLAPNADASKTAAITARTLGYSVSQLEPMKKWDGNSRVNFGDTNGLNKVPVAVDTTRASGDGVVHIIDTVTLEDVHLNTYSASYYEGDLKETTSATGSHPIKITGTLTGADAGNYVLADDISNGKILPADAVISATYDSKSGWLPDWSDTGKTLATGYTPFYKDITKFYALGSDGKIYQSDNLSNWTQYTSTRVSADAVLSSSTCQLIGLDRDGLPLAVGSNGEIYYWFDSAWRDNGTAFLTGDAPQRNFTYFTDGTKDYLIYQDSSGNVYKSEFNNYSTLITTQTAPKLLSSFSSSLLAYNGTTLVLYAY